MTGDLDLPGLGLQADLPDLKAVVHLGATFAWGLAPQAARRTNVDGALAVAELARRSNAELAPREAVSAVSNILESFCKTYIAENNLEVPAKQDLKSIWTVVRKHLGFGLVRKGGHSLIVPTRNDRSTAWTMSSAHPTGLQKLFPYGHRVFERQVSGNLIAIRAEICVGLIGIAICEALLKLGFGQITTAR